MAFEYNQTASKLQASERAAAYGGKGLAQGPPTSSVKYIPSYKPAMHWNIFNSPNRVRIFQEFFRFDKSHDPVFLRAGPKDVMLYRGVMGFSVLGLGIAFYGIYLMATGNMKKKGGS